MTDEPGPFRSIDAALVTIGKRADLSAKGNQRKVSALHKRRMARLEGRGRAAAVIDPLPAPGECLHLAINGTYSGWAVALAIADLITAPIDHLTISTLGFHRDNADDLIAWLDAGAWIIPNVRYSATTSIKHQSQLHRLPGAIRIPWDEGLNGYMGLLNGTKRPYTWEELRKYS